MAERWLSVDEIAEHLGVSRDTVYKWIKRNNLPGHKAGRLWKFTVEEVNAWVRSRSRRLGHVAPAGSDDDVVRKENLT